MAQPCKVATQGKQEEMCVPRTQDKPEATAETQRESREINLEEGVLWHFFPEPSLTAGSGGWKPQSLGDCYTPEAYAGKPTSGRCGGQQESAVLVNCPLSDIPQVRAVVWESSWRGASWCRPLTSCWLYLVTPNRDCKREADCCRMDGSRFRLAARARLNFIEGRSARLLRLSSYPPWSYSALLGLLHADLNSSHVDYQEQQTPILK